MTIAVFDDEALTSVLRENLTPSDFIRTPERLFGRDKHLRTIERALNSAGRQIFIYGDRGVGKTSLALTAAYLHTHSGHRPIHVNCGRTVGFFPVLRAVGNAVLPPQAIFEHQASRANLGFNFAGLGANFSPSAEVVRSVAEPTNLNEAFDIIRYVEQRVASKTTVIVIDEMERIQDTEEKDKFAEFIKNLSTVTEKLKFIFCGIGADLTELLGAHPSAGRILEPIELKSISHDSLWKIIQTPAEKLGIQVDRDKLIRIGQISDGFPHYVHLVGESLFWTISDDSKPIFEANEEHYRSAIRGALARKKQCYGTNSL
jgi:uncharacterized protein